MKRSLALLIVALMTPLSLKAQNHEPSASIDLDDLNPPGVMAGVIRRYTIDRGSLTRFYTAGPTSARRNRFKQFYDEWLDSIERLDFDSMGIDDRVDFTLFKNHLEYELRQLEIESQRLAEMQSLVPFASALMDLEDARRRMEAMDSPKTAALLTSAVKQIEEIRKTVESALWFSP